MRKKTTCKELRHSNALALIRDIGYGYDGYDTTNARQMQSLVDEFIQIATLALYPETAKDPSERAMISSMEEDWNSVRKFQEEEDFILRKSLANRKLAIHKE